MINVDKIITISLAENHARRVATENELAKLNIKTNFFLASRDAGHEERGCFNSHLNVCKQALAENCHNLLVFEDDVKITSYHAKQIDRLNHFIQKHSHQFDVLYLGLIIGKMWFCWRKSIVRTRGAGAHAYILSRRGMEKLAKYNYEGIPVDKILKRDFQCYSVYPIIAEQHPETVCTSDISPFRNTKDIKDEKFWHENAKKQLLLPWKYLYKTLTDP